ncbi:MAG: FAD-dependent oxidoreductase [Bacteroidales bacterium]|nr:FAD-dependent oxidoreductase [Bacteroidales bacterium]MCF8404587.1 FAD-dependent oxidoreductase [Bacteroidales bacterium]
MKQVIIIGNGISGITAARHIRKLSDMPITVISSESDHFFSRTALMYIYMGHMKYEHTKPYEDWFWEKNKIKLVNAPVEAVNTKDKILSIKEGNTLKYDILIIASGSKPNKFGWPGQDIKGVSGMYSMQDLQQIEKYTAGIKRGVIVGGGLIGIELAEMLHSRNIAVSFLVREKSFWDMVLPVDESEMVNREIRSNKIDLQLDTELKEILADENGRVKAIVTASGEKIECQFVGLTVGVSPNINFINGSGIETDRGILVNEYLETNITDVYAIGDCAQHRQPPGERRPVEQVWYTGRMMGETLAQSICGYRTKYQPGIWFNSAKFFDIEYQTYGWVWNKLRQDEASLYWENGKGNKCLRLVYHKQNKALLGINVFGMRIRHELAEKWIKEKKNVKEVVGDLKAARFDPEFYPIHEKEIEKKFNSELVF